RSIPHFATEPGRRRNALGVGHLGLEQLRGSVEEIAVVGVRKAQKEGSRRQTRELAEPESMRELVQENGDQIKPSTVVAVESEVEVEGTAEVGVDVVVRGVQIHARELVRQ